MKEENREETTPSFPYKNSVTSFQKYTSTYDDLFLVNKFYKTVKNKYNLTVHMFFFPTKD